MSETASLIPAWSDLQPDPLDETLSELTARLSALDGPVDDSGAWPGELWSALTDRSVSSWSLPARWHGADCERTLLLQRYARVAEGSLTAAFILSQHDAAVRRLVGTDDRDCARTWLERIARGDAFGTIGISQLTTSRRHGAQALSARETASGFRLDGVIPWVTAAERADVIVTGAVLEDGRQLLIALPTDRQGVSVQPPFRLAALQASCTSEVKCDGVDVAEFELLVDPSVNVMASPGVAGTGGLETSAIALGQARAALAALWDESRNRTDLTEPIGALVEGWSAAWDDMNCAALGLDAAPTASQVRSRANALVLRATQAYLAARKGTGFLLSEPAQRWARQALFFLVWSCPGPVAQATIRDLAGICSA